jgi:ATP-dependent Clp protease ATP-binding subunit ClpC
MRKCRGTAGKKPSLYNHPHTFRNMVDIIIPIVVLAAGWLVGFYWKSIVKGFPHKPFEKPADTPDQRLATVVEIASTLEPFASQAARPRDFLSKPEFVRGVEILTDRSVSYSTLLSYYVGANAVVACMALEALGKRNDEEDLFRSITQNINAVWFWVREFALRALDARYDEPIVGRVLSSLNDSWLDTVPIQMLRDFIFARSAKGEEPSWRGALAGLPSRQLDVLEHLLNRLELDFCGPLISDLKEEKNKSVDREFLRALGRLYDAASQPAEGILENDKLLGAVLELQESVLRVPSSSVMLIGESGVGKSAILEVFSRELVKQGWLVFRCGAADLLSGQMYIGQLEERIRTLIAQLSGKKVVWIVPNIHELAWAGMHKFNQTGILDILLPHIEDGSVVVIGETRPAAYDRLIQAKPFLRSKFSRIMVSPMEESETGQLARQWLEAQKKDLSAPPIMAEETLREAFQLAHQYLASKAAPGNIMDFLKTTWLRVVHDGGPGAVSVDDLLHTLSGFTGLPLSILDDREELDLQNVREFFDSRVLGQPEAVGCVLERIALIKAGLTDPTRPQAVFLFAGPTGTGKTELAKTLAGYLFGSASRIVRMDMSEFQTQESLERIIGDGGDESSANSLVQQIRNQPFSVLLLDEVEKAHPNVWDLFLQVFDDGRLTDRKGNSCDFRHAIIIMTSNLGAAIPTGEVVGFGGASVRFSVAQVEKTVTSTFRREFINRIDRIIVFRPLTREVMREILRAELRRAFQRRGMRRREWAVEWDESALDFLLAKGFTPDLGARPLLRAIERYLLTPLAGTIVRRQFPEGDQFLFVRSDGDSIVVEFIDADQGKSVTPQSTGPLPAKTAEAGTTLEHLILDPVGSSSEQELLVGACNQLVATIENDIWRTQKSDLLLLSSSDEIWDSPQRYVMLGKAEFMDRIEVGLHGAKSLIGRLHESAAGKGPAASRQLVSLTAQQIYLLREATESFRLDKPRDAFLLVEPGKSNSGSQRLAEEFAHRIAAMYAGWGEKRKMQVQRIGTHTGVAPGRALFAFSGFGAYSILEKENGLHILETPKEGGAFKRISVTVRVAPQPVMPPGNDIGAIAITEMRKTENKRLRIVRRYREKPSPLVRDDIRGWRTGRIDEVLDGNFDLMQGIR